MSSNSTGSTNSTGAAAGGSKGGSSGGGAGATLPFDPAAENELLSKYLYYVLAAIGGALVVWRVSTWIVKHVRKVSSLTNDTQRYFAEEPGYWTFFKKQLQYAPIFRKRHNREIQLSSAINIGTLPSRLQLLFLAGYVATNVAFCVIDIPFHANFDSAASQLRNRTGVLSVVNMVPLFLLAGRNNPLIPLLGISFDTMNLLHRWFGRISILEALAHTLSWMIPKANKMGWSATFAIIPNSPFLLWGLIGTIAFLVIGIQAASPIRHAFYETFKIFHILLAALSIAGVWYHLDLHDIPQIKYLYAVVALWVADRAARVARVAWANFGRGGTRTLVEALPDNACRVTVTLARPWTFRPGQHAYLYFPTISFLQSHPLSVAWSEEAESPNAADHRLAMNRQEVAATRKTTMSFVVRARTGATASLYKKAAACVDGRLATTCLLEGPYGGTHDMSSYGTVMLFAGGVGITQAVPHVREMVDGYARGTVASRKVVLVWIIQTPEHLEWIRPWMTQILAMDKRRDVLRIMLFVSRPRSTKEIHSPSATVQMFPGRPNIETLMAMEMENQVGTMGVTVCGPGSLSDEVRRAVRARQHLGAVDFCEESFSW